MCARRGLLSVRCFLGASIRHKTVLSFDIPPPRPGMHDASYAMTMGCGHTENARAEDTGLSTVLHSKPVVGVLIVTPHPEAVRIALQAASAAAPACSLLLGRSARGIATSAHPRQQAICKGQTRPPGCEPHRASTHQHWCRTPTEWAAARPALVASSTEAVARYIHPV